VWLTLDVRPKSMHPELSAEACRRLDVLCRLEIPMVRSPASYALAPHFWRAWIDFLFSYKRRSPLLLHYMQEGATAGHYFDPQCVDRKLSVRESWMPRCKADFIASPVSFFWTCHILGPEKRSKHWPPARISLERLKRLSARRDESFFLPGLKPLDAEQGLWVAMAEHFEGIKRKDSFCGC
jgi:hypothetical protein